MPRQAKGTRECPNCGADVPLDSIACPECGSDEETGWSEETEYDDLDLPTGYGKEEEPSRNSRAKEKLWKVVAIVLLILIFLGLLTQLWW